MKRRLKREPHLGYVPFQGIEYLEQRRLLTVQVAQPQATTPIASDLTVTEFPLPFSNSEADAVNLIGEPDGNLWLIQRQLDDQAENIVKVAPNGVATVMPVGAGHHISGYLTLGADGNYWFVDFVATTPTAVQEIGRVTPDGQLTEFTLPNPNDYVQGGLALGPDGNLWFYVHELDPGFGLGTTKLGEISPTGSVSVYSISFDASSTAVTPTFGPDGSLWTNSGGTFVHTEVASSASLQVGIKPTGSPLGASTATVAPESIAGNSLVTGPNGDLWFRDDQNGAIGYVTPTGATKEFPLPTPSAILDEPVLTGPDGNLWAEGAGVIYKVTTNGTTTTYPLVGAQNAFGPLVTGADGNIWFSTDDGNIARMTPSGVLTEFSLPSTGAPRTTVTSPHEIVVGPDGNIWFLDPATGSIGVVSQQSPNGVILNQGRADVTIATVARGGLGFQKTQLTITFSTGLDAATATDLSNYTLMVVGPRGNARPRERPIAIKAATYNPETNSVTLTPLHRLKFAGYYRLTVNGSTPSGIIGSNGVRLSGVEVGVHGSNYTAIVHKAGTVAPLKPHVTKKSPHNK